MKKLAWIIFFAFLLRFFLIGYWHLSGHGAHVSSDAACYHQIAESLAEGRGFQLAGEATARRPPLYPLWIAFFLKTSSFPVGVQMGDALLGGLSCVLLYGITKELFGHREGLLSAGILAVDYMSIRQIVSVLSETLFVFFLLFCFYCLMRSCQTGKNARLFFAGIFAGLALLTREVLILYFPFVALWLLLVGPSGKSRLLKAALFLLGLAVAVCPWVIRNSFLFHRPVMITTTAGHSFYIANNPLATGGTTGGDWEWQRDSFLPYRPDMQLMKPGTDQALLLEGVQFIRESPLNFLRLMKKKIINTWRPYQTDSPELSRWMAGVLYVLVMLLGGVGVVFSAKQWRRLLPIYLLILYIFLLHAVLIAEIRYRYPVMPFFMMFAAVALDRLFSVTQTERKRIAS